MRNDEHSPKNLDPSSYSLLGTWYQGSDPFMQMEFRDEKAYLRERLNESAFKGNFKAKGSCDHCGTLFGMGFVFEHDSGDVIVVGHKCAETFWSGATKLERVWRDMQARVLGGKKALAFCEGHPEGARLKAAFADAVDPAVVDIRKALVKYGNLSEKQVALVLFRSDPVAVAAAAAKKAAEAAAAADVEEGRLDLKGEVVSVKEFVNEFGDQRKLLLKLESGAKVYGNLPAGIWRAQKGAVVAFKATVKRSPNDPKFGFFSNPRNAVFVQEGA